MKDLFEIRITDITAPRLREELKINVGQCKKMLAEFEPNDFESFILEWIKFCEYKDKNDLKILRIGGTGDQGIDVYISYDSCFEIVQCKRYSVTLALPAVRKIITKILWYLCKDKDGYPHKIFISTIRGFNVGAAKFVTNKEKIKSEIIENIKNDLESMAISYKDDEIKSFIKYLDGYTFDNIIATDIDTIITDYFNSEVGGLRFSNKRVELKRQKPTESKINNQVYIETIKELLEGEKESVVEKIVGDAKVDYYSALQLEATCEYLFGNTNEFKIIKEDIKTSVNNELLKSYSNNREKYLAAREKAIGTDVDDSFLSFGLHMVGSRDKSGTCHILTNEGEIYWDEQE